LRFIGQLLAILILLQSLAIGAASQTRGRADAGNGEATAFAAVDCGPAADSRGQPAHRRPRAVCCMLCPIGSSDKLAFQGAFLLARAEFQAPKATITAVARADGGVSMGRLAETGAASSRGPPPFS